MNILLIGGTGLLGGYFQDVFNEKKIPFLAPKSFELNLTDEKSITDFFVQNNPVNFTHIVFAAAYTDVDGAEINQEECENINVFGLENILKYKIPIIHFSTDYVFGQFPKDIEIEEDFPRFPINYYGGTKLRAEKLLEDLDFPYWNIRTTWLFGGKNCFVSKILKKSQEFSELQIVDDEIGRPTFAKDLAIVVTDNFVKKEQKIGNYHIQGSGESVSWAGFADFFLKIRKWDGEIKKIPESSLDRTADRPKNSILKNTKSQIHIRDWKEAVQDFLV